MVDYPFQGSVMNADEHPTNSPDSLKLKKEVPQPKAKQPEKRYKSMGHSGSYEKEFDYVPSGR